MNLSGVIEHPGRINRLGIVQNCETQFDALLYQRIALRESQINLNVVYSKPKPSGLAALEMDYQVAVRRH